jgi:archaellum component FlaF (FlaF/FlaG flagellin family)
MQNYKIDILTFVNNNSVRSDCADITFYNQGQEDITINGGVVLVSGSSISFNANESEIDRTIYYFNFTDTGLPKQLVVFRKIYY